MQISHLLRRRIARATGRALAASEARRERAKDRIEPLDDVIGPPDHQAEAAFQSEDPTARAAVDVVDSPRCQRVRAGDVVGIVRVAAVDDGVARCKMCAEVVDHGTGHAGGNHQPHGARWRQLRDEVGNRARTDGPRRGEGIDGGCAVVVHDALVAGMHAAAHEVRAHAAESDHPELHVNSCRL